jgi:hypothetical protein
LKVQTSIFCNNLKSSYPQRSWEAIKIISAVFAGSVIIEGFGKISGCAGEKVACNSGGHLSTKKEVAIRKK